MLQEFLNIMNKKEEMGCWRDSECRHGIFNKRRMERVGYIQFVLYVLLIEKNQMKYRPAFQAAHCVSLPVHAFLIPWHSGDLGIGWFMATDSLSWALFQ